MPIHDWTRVGAGTFHDFHVAWIAELRNALNERVLPSDYYAMAEQIAGPLGPDVLTLQAIAGNAEHSSASAASPLALATTAPRVQYTAEVELDDYAAKHRTLVIRHSSDDRIVALIELLSPGNKSSRHAVRSFVDKAIEALYRGYHLLIVDLHPPGPRDPQGIHGVVWAEISDESFTLPHGKSLTVVAYSAGIIKRAFAEFLGVDDELPEMPLFLEVESYVNVPLEATYQAAYRGVPRRWKSVLEEPAKR